MKYRETVLGYTKKGLRRDGYDFAPIFLAVFMSFLGRNITFIVSFLCLLTLLFFFLLFHIYFYKRLGGFVRPPLLTILSTKLFFPLLSHYYLLFLLSFFCSCILFLFSCLLLFFLSSFLFIFFFPFILRPVVLSSFLFLIYLD